VTTKLGSACVLIVACAVLTACNQISQTGCSSPDAISTTESLISDQIEKNAVAKSKGEDGSVSVPEASIRASVALAKISIDDVRTTKIDPNSTKRFCSGTARVVIPLGVIQDADRARSLQSLNTVQQLADSASIQRSADSFTFPIDYDVQPTDDRTKIYAESDSISAQMEVFSQIMLGSLLKYQLENQATAQQQLQQQQAQQAALLAQQARQAGFDDASAENKLSVQTINATWNSIEPDTREELLDVQRAWIKEKVANCKIQAASSSTDPTDQETARLKCDTAANQQRADWLKQYLPAG
jgi:hypothetical protein